MAKLREFSIVFSFRGKGMHPGRDHQNLFQAAGLPDVFRQEYVPFMDWVEGPAQNPDAAVITQCLLSPLNPGFAFIMCPN